MESAFPELTFHPVALDHPIYHTLSAVKDVSYPKNLDSRVPCLGLHVHSWLGVLVSKFLFI